MKTIFDLQEEVNALVEEYINSGNIGVRARTLGLDSRAGNNFFVSDELDVIGVNNSDRGPLEYYGDFQYVKEEHRLTLGDWTFYVGGKDGSRRVQQCLDRYAGTSSE
jgi:hypothetical protein